MAAARSRPVRAIGPVVAGAVPLGVFEYLRRLAPADPLLAAPIPHFYVVSAASLLAGVIAAAVGVAGWRQRNVGVTFVGLAFMSLAFLFGLHGLSTPGMLLPPSQLPSVAAQLSVLTAALWLALSSAPSGSRVVKWLAGRQLLLVPAWAVVLGVIWGVSLRWPGMWAGVPIGMPVFSWPVAGVTILASVVAAERYWGSYAYSRFPLQLALVYACAWLASAQWIMTYGQTWRLSWWIYHLELLLATAALVVGMVRQYSQGTSLAEALLGLFLSDPVRRLEAGLTDSVRALVVATEARDPYTAGHSYRVAIQAVRLGQATGLSGDKLRALAQGGLLHDVGKLEIPDAVLNKPGPLTPEEWQAIRRHPVTGFQMCSRLGFMPEELDVIRYHHERWDGTGYPAGLSGEQIPLLARILAVVDVYDALTSARAYRGPWSHEQARTYILEQAGRQFCPRCVQAWFNLTADGPVAARESLAAPLGWRPAPPQ